MLSRILLLLSLAFPLAALASFSPMPAESSPRTPSAFSPEADAGHPQLLAKKWKDLSDQEKKRIREAKEKYDRLPADRQENLRRKWEDMPKKEKEKYQLERKRR